MNKASETAVAGEREGEGKHDEGHAVTIIVNARPKVVTKKELSFREVVALAYENPVFSETIAYTVTYKKGHPPRHEGQLVDGEFLKVKKDMVVNVVRTDKS